tara:strand:+ start:2071 stop:2268 length:198 start_codon:yes stop_codon:yes gene_type:complete
MNLVDIQTPRCMMCGKRGTVSASSKGVRRWREGELIQRCLPELDADQAEQMISGTHPDCYEALFA